MKFRTLLDPFFSAVPHGVKKTPKKTVISIWRSSFGASKKFLYSKWFSWPKYKKKILSIFFFQIFWRVRAKILKNHEKNTPHFAKTPNFKSPLQDRMVKKKKNLDFEVLHQKCVENPGGHGGALRILIRVVFEKLEQFSWTSLFFLYSKMNRIRKRTLQRLAYISKLWFSSKFEDQNVGQKKNICALAIFF